MKEKTDQSQRWANALAAMSQTIALGSVRLGPMFDLSIVGLRLTMGSGETAPCDDNTTASTGAQTIERLC